MSLVIEISPLGSVKAGMIDFTTPQSSHETMLVQIPETIDDLFVHKSQTDQILLVKGRFGTVTLIDRHHYTPLSEDRPVVVKIPPGATRAINLDPEPCVVVNAVLRHRPAQERDSCPTSDLFLMTLPQLKPRLQKSTPE